MTEMHANGVTQHDGSERACACAHINGVNDASNHTHTDNHNNHMHHMCMHTNTQSGFDITENTMRKTTGLREICSQGATQEMHATETTCRVEHIICVIGHTSVHTEMQCAIVMPLISNNGDLYVLNMAQLVSSCHNPTHQHT